jgi:hypothetical protein
MAVARWTVWVAATRAYGAAERVEIAACNQPVKLPCPHCTNPEAKLLPRHGVFDAFDCHTCGEYAISGTQTVLFQHREADPATATFRQGWKRLWLES